MLVHHLQRKFHSIFRGFIRPFSTGSVSCFLHAYCQFFAYFSKISCVELHKQGFVPDIIAKALRIFGPGIIDLEANLTWKRLKVHSVPVARYCAWAKAPPERRSSGRSSKRKTRGSRPFRSRWLGRASDVKACFREETTVASSVALAVVGRC